ncbi:peptide chain release factor N(5)-glutamine methyltransferase [Flavihumibacter sp. UBA7668]|uniref:peptide chain release factor N(5)-glutamine methyltransferase n=1 Tax=Flavihumibacter sp. UBA7668 TaxID=1946542 RepID=UPI0025BF89B0|nr:peptide chain release factor N(5)-glutamine methyltransferase [Flavihumibacter sp. UBA7668]
MSTPRDHIIRQLSPLYGKEEAGIISEMVLGKISGLPRQEVRHIKAANLSDQQQVQLEEMLEQLVSHRPIQYVLNEAWFQEMPFFVDERVLIPRPETEELVEWVIQDYRAIAAPVILDIGSGSGCIPISLAKKLPTAQIHSCDLSSSALTVAHLNAARLNAVVHWQELDFLDESNWSALPAPNCIVSNPPYIPKQEADLMSQHVVVYEPGMALFVPDQNPYLFYKAIARFALQKTKSGAGIYLEIHEDHPLGVRQVLEHCGMKNIEIRKDMQGKDRMVKAIRP